MLTHVNLMLDDNAEYFGAQFDFSTWRTPGTVKHWIVQVDNEFIQDWVPLQYTLKKTEALRIPDNLLKKFLSELDYFEFQMSLVTVYPTSYVGPAAKVVTAKDIFI